MTIKQLTNKLKTATHKSNAANKKVAKLERELLKMTIENEPEISDHAVVRYLERVGGIDIKALKKGMLNDNDRAAIGLGCTRIRKANHTIVINHGVVITILEAK